MLKVNIKNNSVEMISFAKFINNIEMEIYAKDIFGKFIYANESFLRRVGKSFEELTKVFDCDVFDLKKIPNMLNDERYVLNTLNTLSTYDEIYLKNGIFYIVEAKKEIIVDEKNKKVGIICINRDITRKKFFQNKIKKFYLKNTDDNYNEDKKLKNKKIDLPLNMDDSLPLVKTISESLIEVKLEKQIKKISMSDYLTGIFSKKYFKQEGEKEFLRCKKFNQKLSILLFDIDKFKLINKKYGHVVGDEILKFFTLEISKNIRFEDSFCRVGGEKFAIIAPQISIKNAEKFAARLKKIFINYEFPNLKNIKSEFSFSFGISSYKISDFNFDVLYRRAEQALSIAQSNGRGEMFIVD